MKNNQRKLHLEIKSSFLNTSWVKGTVQDQNK